MTGPLVMTLRLTAEQAAALERLRARTEAKLASLGLAHHRVTLSSVIAGLITSQDLEDRVRQGGGVDP